jgi:hypothetical protein
MMPAAKNAVILFIYPINFKKTLRRLAPVSEPGKPFVKDFTNSPNAGESLAKKVLKVRQKRGGENIQTPSTKLQRSEPLARKLQATTSKLQRSSKLQIPTLVRRLGAWRLVLLTPVGYENIAGRST